MGKQICFFANEVDLKEMFKIVALDEIVLLNKTGEIVTIEDFFSCIDSYFQKDNQLTQTWYLSCSDSKIEYIISGDYRCVNPLKSDVIEFHHCTKIPSKILDTSSVNNMFLKNGFIVIDDTDKYNSLMEELRRNPKYINNPHYKKMGLNMDVFGAMIAFVMIKGTNCLENSIKLKDIFLKTIFYQNRSMLTLAHMRLMI